MSLPSGYIEMAWITFESGAYINTGIVPSNHKTEIKLNDPAYLSAKVWLGTQAGASYYHFTIYNNKYYWGRNGSEANGGSFTAGDHLLIYNGDNNSVVLDGTTLGSGTNITSSGSNTLDLGRRSGGGVGFVGRIYYCKITDKSTGNLVRNFIPAYRESDGACGLYDLISSSFFTNSGSGLITTGKVIDSPHKMMIIETDNPLTLSIASNTYTIAVFELAKNCYYKVSGDWKEGLMYKKISGSWEKGPTYIKISDSWKPGN